MSKEIEYMPIGTVKRRGDINTQGFSDTNIKKNGKRVGTTKANVSKLAALIVAGSLVVGGAAFVKNATSAPKEAPVTIEQTTEDLNITPVKVVETCNVDYRVEAGDTLDGIIYKYAENPNQKDSIKRDVIYYNDLNEYGSLQMGQVIVLTRVPVDMVEELNTGYDESVDMNDELSVTLNQAVAELNEQLPDAAIGSLLDTVNNELAVYNSTTSKAVRKQLARKINVQIGQIQQYEIGNIEEGRSR